MHPALPPHTPSDDHPAGCWCGQDDACAQAGTPRSLWQARRAFLLLGGTATASAALPAWAQVDVGESSRLRHLVPAEELEQAAEQEYAKLLQEARSQGKLVPTGDAQTQRLQRIAQALIQHTAAWNERARQWQWSVALIRSNDINAFCMPGGKIAFFTGIIDKLRLSDDEIAMVMGHEMAHALREHSREQLAKNTATSLGISLGAQLLGLGDVGNYAARLGGQLLSLRFSRNDESDADLVGLEIAARAGYNPNAAVSLWEKMGNATGSNANGLAFLSTHPSGPERIRELQRNVPRVTGLYEAARRR
ncbi:M48 family metallopeptidase [Comamonas aquatica]|uniref:M48 family metallopeptidase n=1 Tax=Comamonas aquatica TaxID=225991 RepID=UPI0009F1C4E6|nr:M48 family metallopeptidase [Comamonas aquatica]